MDKARAHTRTRARKGQTFNDADLSIFYPPLQTSFYPHPRTLFLISADPSVDANLPSPPSSIPLLQPFDDYVAVTS